MVPSLPNTFASEVPLDDAFWSKIISAANEQAEKDIKAYDRFVRLY